MVKAKQDTKQQEQPQTTLIGAVEIAQMLGCSKEYGYKIIRQLNAILEEQGFLTMQGKTSRKFYNERFYG